MILVLLNIISNGVEVDNDSNNDDDDRAIPRTS